MIENGQGVFANIKNTVPPPPVGGERSKARWISVIKCMGFVTIICKIKDDNLGDHHLRIDDLCHYKCGEAFININAMFRQELKDFPLFQGFSEDQIEWLAEQFEVLSFSSNTVIFEQGQSADHLYILSSGKVIIRYKPYDGPPLKVASIFPGGVFGWSAALGRHVYTSTALASEESETYRISGLSLSTLCEKCPDTGAILLQRLAQAVNERQQSLETETEILGILRTSIDKKGDCSRRMDPNGR